MKHWKLSVAISAQVMNSPRGGSQQFPFVFQFIFQLDFVFSNNDRRETIMVGQFKVFSETQPISVETINPLEIPLSFGFICLLFKLFRFAFSDYNQAVKD